MLGLEVPLRPVFSTTFHFSSTTLLLANTHLGFGQLEDWEQWSSAIPAKKIFLGLAAAPDAAGSRFIPIADLTSKVLPSIKGSDNWHVGWCDIVVKVLFDHTGHDS